MSERGVTGAELVRAAIRDRIGALTVSCAAAAVYQTGQVMIPILVGFIVDSAIGGGSVPRLALGIAVLAADFLALALGWRMSQRWSQRAATAAAHTVRLQLTERVLSPHGGADTGRLPGTLASLAIGDARRFGMIHHAMPHLVAATAAVLIGGVAVLAVSVPLGLLILVGCPGLLWLINRLGGPLQRRTAAQQSAVADASGVAVDLLVGIRVVKGLGAEPAAMHRYRETSRRSMSTAVEAGRMLGAYRGAVLAANGLFLALVALVGAELAAGGGISVGGFIAAIGLTRFLVGPLSMFGTMSTVLVQARASAVRLAEVLSVPPAVAVESPAYSTVIPRGELQLCGVHHGELAGLDLSVVPGTTVGVVTDRHAMADDLMDLLARRADPTSGSVLLDGVDVIDLGPDIVRRSLLAAAHDADLFHGTVLDNVAAGRAGGDKLAAAMSAARADQVCEVLPAGGATPVGHRGKVLSGGQRQRVALARALAQDAPILVLHDPTTAVDTVTESVIADRLRAIRRGRTTILLTSSPTLLDVADRVVVVRDGRVVAEGRHADLLIADDAYCRTVLS